MLEFLSLDGPGAADAAAGGGQLSTASQEASKLKVFVSYSREDLEFADQLVAGLILCGFEPLIDRTGISGGEAWQERLGNLIREADTVAFVLSRASASSPICGWEVEEAVRLSKRILPVVCGSLEGSSPPAQLQDLNYIYFYREPETPGSGFGVGLSRLVAALNTDVGWIREHTRLLVRASEWGSGRPSAEPAALRQRRRRGQGMARAAAEGCAGADGPASRLHTCQRAGGNRSSKHGAAAACRDFVGAGRARARAEGGRDRAAGEGRSVPAARTANGDGARCRGRLGHS